MIKVFTRESGTGRTEMNWLDDHSIPYKQIKMKDMELFDFIHILSLTENGVSELLISSNRRDSHRANYMEHLLDDEPSLSSALSLLKRFPDCFKAPIVLDENKLMIRFNSEDIHVFLPRQFRNSKIAF